MVPLPKLPSSSIRKTYDGQYHSTKAKSQGKEQPKQTQKVNHEKSTSLAVTGEVAIVASFTESNRITLTPVLLKPPVLNELLSSLLHISITTESSSLM